MKEYKCRKCGDNIKSCIGCFFLTDEENDALIRREEAEIEALEEWELEYREETEQ